MSKRVPLGLTILLVIFAALITFLSTYVGIGVWRLSGGSITDKDSDLYRKLQSVDEYFRAYYIHELDEEGIIDGIIAGYVAGSGDKYAAYLNKEAYAEFLRDNNAQLQGIGVHVVYNTEYRAIEVINVMPDSPALAAGVQPGDLIVAVGETSVTALGYYAAVNAMRGEAGTYVTFTVMRGEDYSEQKEFHIERGYVTEQTVLSRLYAADPTIGIVRILQFDNGTPDQFIAALESLQAQGANKFVLDVRYNPGGDLQAICSVLDYLLPEGPIIRIAYKNGQENVLKSDTAEFDFPMAVLVNQNTASAGELFASALQDYKKATLVGVTTYGKGTMQSVIKLADDSAISISVALYYPPFSDNYEGIGVKPDIEVEMPEHLKNVNIYKISDSEDTQLQAAIQTLS